jgi:hypothetical protein
MLLVLEVINYFGELQARENSCSSGVRIKSHYSPIALIMAIDFM